MIPNTGPSVIVAKVPLLRTELIVRNLSKGGKEREKEQNRKHIKSNQNKTNPKTPSRSSEVPSL